VKLDGDFVEDASANEEGLSAQEVRYRPPVAAVSPQELILKSEPL